MSFGELPSSLISLLANATPEGRFVNLLIGVLFLVGLGVMVFRFRQLRQEVRALAWARAGMRLRAGTPQDLQEAAAEVARRGPEGGLAARRLREMASCAGLEEAGAALREQAEARMALWGEWPRHLASLAIFLGLLGTVWGLAAAVGGLHEQLRSVTSLNQLPALMGAMGGTLRSMRTAFSCTATGLIATLVLSLLNLWLTNQQSAFLLELESFTTTEVLPKVGVARPEHAAQVFSTTLQEGARQLRQTVDDLSSVMSGVGEKLEDTARRFSAELATVTGTLEIGSRSMASLTELLREAQGTLDKHRADIAGVYTDISDKLAQLASGQGERLRATDQTIARIEDYQAQAAQAMGAVRTAQDSLLSALSSLEATLRSGPEAYREEIAGMAGSFTDTARAMTDGVSESLRQTLAEQRAIYEAIAGLTEAMQKLQRTVTEAMTRPVELPKFELPEVKAAGDHFAAASRDLVRSLGVLSDRLESVLYASSRGSQPPMGWETPDPRLTPRPPEERTPLDYGEELIPQSPPKPTATRTPRQYDPDGRVPRKIVRSAGQDRGEGTLSRWLRGLGFGGSRRRPR